MPLTPGPWHVVESDGAWAVGPTMPDGSAGVDPVVICTREDDARTIGLLPELLTALDDAYSVLARAIAAIDDTGTR